MASAGTYRANVGSQQVDLPIVPINDDLAIALLMTVDMGIRFMTVAGFELAQQLAPDTPECVVSMATLGIPVAIEVSRSLALDDYLILQKTPKIHLADALRVSVDAITTATSQHLLLDRERISAVRGRRVALVDDVISTGASMAAGLRLLDEAGADVVAIGTLLAEGDSWTAELGSRAPLLRSLGRIPLFRPDAEGRWQAQAL